MATKITKPAPKSKVSKAKGFDEFIEEGTSPNDETNIVLSSPQSAMTAYSNTPNIDTSDVFIPKLRLAQALTAEVTNGTAKSGQWVVSGEDPMVKPVIVPLLMNRRRELRDPDENRQILCRSFDSLKGVGNPGGDCSTCPMAKWTEGKKGKGNSAPQCNFIYSYVIYIVDLDAVVILEFSRTSIAAGKMLNSVIMAKGLGNFAVQLSSAASKNGRGQTFYSPIINGAKVTDKVMAIAKRKAEDMFGA
jgi:hypothetical protein